MGQYYKAVVLKKDTNDNPVKAAISSYDFANGAKLMEHSYVHNDMVRAAEWLLAQDKEGQPFVWSGDYADEFKDDKNIFDFATDEICKQTAESMPTKVEDDSWVGRFYAVAEPKDYKFVINHTKKLYVAIPEHKYGETTIHPLPLLTADGNGRGGGDYHGTDMEHVGSWKYDTISVGDEIPNGFEELEVHFEE